MAEIIKVGESIKRTFATGPVISEGFIKFLHDITKDAVSSVEEMRRAIKDVEKQFSIPDSSDDKKTLT